MNAMIPSIDIMDGRAVQLVGGETKALDGGDPLELIEKFGRVGDVAVIDLDAAMGRGSNAELITKMLNCASCRVGGGIRDAASALEWLDRGASKVILGTRAVPEILRELPRERVIAAVDARNGEVVVEGWKSGTGATIEERVDALAPYVSGYLVTFVENEGRLGGMDFERTAALQTRVGDRNLTVAGGVKSAHELLQLRKMGVEAQVGMALYTGRFDLAGGVWAQLEGDRDDGLIATVVCDPAGVALGLAWSSEESLRVAIEEGRGVYQSRKRGLWRKGESSGNVQKLLGVDVDCDGDALRFRVAQSGQGFCHLERHDCWGQDRGRARLERRLAERKLDAPAGSYTQRLLTEPGLLGAKLREEAGELDEAKSPTDIVHEATDVVYFTQVKLLANDIPWSAIDDELDRRAFKVRRRGGDRKDGQ